MKDIAKEYLRSGRAWKRGQGETQGLQSPWRGSVKEQELARMSNARKMSKVKIPHAC